MRIFVICDLEGMAGVVDHRKQCWFDGDHYLQARRLATLELNALVEGALEGGATEIWAWDGHGGFPGGIDVELMHPECQLLMGAGDEGPVGLDKSFDAMFLLGFHAMAGTPGGVLAHSFWPGIAGCWVNGQPIGEIGVNIHSAGEHDVPTVFIAGDRAAVEEARALIPDIEGVIVKEGLTTNVNGLEQGPMLSLAPCKARDLIREAARRAMGRIGEINPFAYKGPYLCRTRFLESSMADERMNQPGIRRIDSQTLEIEHKEGLWLIL